MRKRLLAFSSLLIIIVVFFIYKSQFTKIGLVNFRDSQMAEIVMANDNHFIETIQVDPKTNNFDDLTDYDVIYLFHISILSTEQKENIKKAMKNGSKVHVLMATSKENDFSNITGDDLKYVKKCFENNSVENIKRWLNYSRKVFHKRTLFTSEVTEPKDFPDDVFYRIGTDDYFEKLEDYWSYYRKEKLFKESRPKIVIMSANNGPQSQFRSYMDELILELENRKFNVIALAGYKKKLENLKKIDPQMVIAFPHGRLSNGDKSVQWLKEKNILYLTAQLIYQSEEEWKNDQQGISGGIMGQNIVVPELDGAIHPYAIAAEYITESGFHTFKPIPERVKRFADNVERWLSLKERKNSEKKLAIYYYKGAGKNAMVAGGLEVGKSIYSLLKKLKSQGYNLGDFPQDYESFINRINTEGPLLGNYAKGTFKKFLDEGKPELIPVEDYESWCKTELDPTSYQNVLKTYGKAPGSYLAVSLKKKKYLAIPRVLFGNIALLPVLPSAMGENEFKLSHGVKKAPPHAYIASYLWSRMGFKADVVAHFGAHGSVEFTPWKQLVLSLQDWPEALVAPVPHLYIYSIDNIGEAMMAKRRTYATMISHLTPPYSEAELYGNLRKMSEIIEKYSHIRNENLKKRYKKKIQNLIDSLNIDKDLELNAEQVENLDNETVEMVHHYIHEVEAEKIKMGLHTLGVKQSDTEKKETVRMMSIDPISSSIRQLYEYRTGRKIKKGLDQHHHHRKVRKLSDIPEEDYEKRANFIIGQIIDKKAKPLSLFGEKNEKELLKYQEEYGSLEKSPISAYYGGSYARKERKKPKPKTEMVYDPKTHKMVPKGSLKPDKLTPEKAGKLLVHLLAMRSSEKAVKHIQTDEGYKEFSGLLDKKSLSQFRTAAKFNEDMAWKVDALENKSFLKFLKFIQDSSKKVTVFNRLNDKSVLEKISSYRKKIDARIMKKASENKRLGSFLSIYKKENTVLKSEFKKYTKNELTSLKADIDFYLKNKDAIIESTEAGKNIEVLKKILDSQAALERLKPKEKLVKLSLDKEINREKNIYAALVQLRESILDINIHLSSISISPSLELDAFINGMNGGYIEPSSGGDPVANPLAVPTGKNLYSINEQVTPTKEAYETGKILAEQILRKHIAKHGDYPKKIAYSLWGGEFIRNQGMNIGQIFYMLGAEPVRNTFGRVHDVRLIPMEKLKRPRIDVLVQTSGQFRDIAASRIYLINKAIKLASEADDESNEYKNYVKEGTLTAENELKSKGFSPEDARKYSTVRVFGGLNGNYGTSIMGLVERGDKWSDEKEIADRYKKNMGAMYSKDNWAEYKPGMFEAMMHNTEIVVHPRSSNETGPISLDHVYEFMGGLTASIRVTTGKDPDGYFNDNRNRHNPTTQTVKEAIWTETRTNLFNPKFIKAQMEEGETAAEGFAENFRDTYGWNVMKPSAIDKEIWEGYYDIYVKDKQKLGTIDFFRKTNPYALQEMTAVMLETVRKGYWNASETVKKDIAKLHAELIKDHKAGCSGFVCDNSKLKEMISALLDNDLDLIYKKEISTVRTGSDQNNENPDNAVLLEKEVLEQEEFIQTLKANLSTILLLIGILAATIILGIIRRRKEEGE